MSATRPHLSSPNRPRGFTLLEVSLALAASAVLLSAVYGVFSKAIHLRDDATERTRQSRARVRAAGILSDDLRNARISGGALAAVLQGSRDPQGGQFPGTLTLATTTARPGQDTPGGDLQQVHYFVADDTRQANAGVLVRTAQTNLLAPVTEEPAPEILIDQVTALEPGFFDGQTWTERWDYTPENPALPQAIRVTVRRSNGNAPLEVTVPWTTQTIAAP